jgi:prepilin-type N-terminal cleavage/methylation domain-containing protein
MSGGGVASALLRSGALPRKLLAASRQPLRASLEYTMRHCQQRAQRPPAADRRAFTLIELLVAIAIIAILAATTGQPRQHRVAAERLTPVT